MHLTGTMCYIICTKCYKKKVDYFNRRNGEVRCPSNQEQYGYSRQHLDSFQCTSCDRCRPAGTLPPTSTACFNGLRLRTGGSDGPTSTPQIGSQTTVVDVEDSLRQEVRNNEKKQRVNGRLKAVPRCVADSNFVTVL